MDSMELLREALKKVTGLQLAVLFGSAARGETRDDSDLDVAVLLDGSAAPPTRLEASLSRQAGRQVDLIVLNHAPPLLRFEVARDGCVLYEATSHAWSDFRARSMVDWWDWAPTASMINAAAARRLREPYGPA